MVEGNEVDERPGVDDATEKSSERIIGGEDGVGHEDGDVRRHTLRNDLTSPLVGAKEVAFSARILFANEEDKPCGDVREVPVEFEVVFVVCHLETTIVLEREIFRALGVQSRLP